MPELGVVKMSQSKGTSTLVCGIEPRLHRRVPSETLSGKSRPKNISNIEASHTHTKSGVRPTVAFHMQEMDGRPSHDSTASTSAECNEGRKEEYSGKGKVDPGGADSFIKEYVVSATLADGRCLTEWACVR